MKRALISLLTICAFATGPALAQDLAVDEATICLSVVDRMPQDPGDIFTADVGQVYCFSKISGGAEGAMIRHVWKMGDQEMAVVELNIGGSPWRTWSSKKIDPTWSGAWTVEIQDAQGMVLQTLNFTIE